MQFKGKALTISAIFAFLFVLMLPLRPVYDISNGLTITATGERNPLAQSGEVWLASSMLDSIRSSATRFDEGWEQRDGNLVSFRGQPATIESNTPIKEGDVLTFTMHAFSGIVEVRSGKFSQRYDLFSATPGTLRVDLYKILPRELNVGRTAFNAIAIFVVAFLAFYVATLFLTRKTSAGVLAPNVRPGKPKLSLWLAIPSLVVYGAVLMAYWPVQMSGDSVDQWAQIVSGRYSDAHPVFSTLFYKIPYLIYPAPQAAAIFQILAFVAVTWFFLWEVRQWGVPASVTAVAAVLFPLFPANFMLVTTLWKDVPFAIGLMLLSTLAAREVRNKLPLSWGSLFAMSLAGILIFGVRHNGIVICVIFFALLFLFAKGRPKKLRVTAAFVGQLAIFLAFKTLLLTAMNAAPVGPHYRSIFALHILGAMEKADVQFDSADRALMNKVLPHDEWVNTYDCRSVVPLFWNKHVSYQALGENAADLNALMFRQIALHPAVFLRHQLCVTGLIWRIGGEKDEFLALAPTGIFDMPQGRELGLHTTSLWPQLKTTLDIWHDQVFATSSMLIRPATYMLLGLFAGLMVMCRSGRAASLIVVPTLFNCLGQVLLMGSQDYRYLWPSVAMSLLLIVMAIGMAISGRRISQQH